MKKHNLLSFSQFANKSTIKALDREINYDKNPPTVTPSNSYSTQRFLDNNGYNDINLCSQKYVNRKKQINNELMELITKSFLTISDADRILNDFRDLVPDLPRGIRSVLRTCTIVQPKIISGGVFSGIGS
ncbi:unnamed protein product [Schistosoma bovis]|nr:unnamed protein product [Schistosoma bovis]